MTSPVTILATLAVAGGMTELMPECERIVGGPISAVFGPTRELQGRIDAGGAADIAILTDAGIEALIAAGALAAGSRLDLARSFIGVAVKAGAPRPDISSPAAFRQAVIDARSIAFSAAGASGIFFANLIEQLGVSDIVRSKATVIPTGFTGELVASGAVELAVQQISELMVVPGIDIVGRLPTALHGGAVFSAAAFIGARPEASPLLEFLSSGRAALIFQRHGLEPIAPL